MSFTNKSYKNGTSCSRFFRRRKYKLNFGKKNSINAYMFKDIQAVSITPASKVYCSGHRNVTKGMFYDITLYHWVNYPATWWIHLVSLFTFIDWIQGRIKNPVKHVRWSVLQKKLLDVWQGSEYASVIPKYVVLCAIWYHSYKLKNVKNTHGGVLLKVALLLGCFSRSWNCAYSIKSGNAPHMLYLDIIVFYSIHLWAYTYQKKTCILVYSCLF